MNALTVLRSIAEQPCQFIFNKKGDQMRVLVLALSVVLLSGCGTSGYKKFYTALPGATPQAIAADRAQPAPAEPALNRAPGFENLDLVYGRKGYAVIGYSSFSSGGRERDTDAAAQAKNVGADLVVVINPQYAETVSSSIPITVPTTSTTVTNSTATVTGPGGTASGYGTATSTTYGSRTTYINSRVDRYNYGAVYFIKRKFRFGAQLRELDDAERKLLETNRGAVVIYVVDGTPAYEADLLSGDIVLAINGRSVSNVDGFLQLLSQIPAGTMDVTISRGGRTIIKSMAIGD